MVVGDRADFSLVQFYYIFNNGYNLSQPLIFILCWDYKVTNNSEGS